MFFFFLECVNDRGHDIEDDEIPFLKKYATMRGEVRNNTALKDNGVKIDIAAESNFLFLERMLAKTDVSVYCVWKERRSDVDKLALLDGTTRYRRQFRS